MLSLGFITSNIVKPVNYGRSDKVAEKHNIILLHCSECDRKVQKYTKYVKNFGRLVQVK